MRVVLDTGVLVAGFAQPASPSGRIVQAWREGSLGLVVSGPLLREIAGVLAYPRVARRVGFDAAEVERFVEELWFFAEPVDVAGVRGEVPGEAGDHPAFAALLASGAERLVASDSPVLALQEQFPILSPAQFVARSF